MHAAAQMGEAFVEIFRRGSVGQQHLDDLRGQRLFQGALAQRVEDFVACNGKQPRPEIRSLVEIRGLAGHCEKGFLHDVVETVWVRHQRP